MDSDKQGIWLKIYLSAELLRDVDPGMLEAIVKDEAARLLREEILKQSLDNQREPCFNCVRTKRNSLFASPQVNSADIFSYVLCNCGGAP